MQSILSTMAKPPFNMEVTTEDQRIFNEIHQGYLLHRCNEEHSLLFTNITFLLTKKSLLDFLLSHLETDVKAMWDEEKTNRDSSLSLHQPYQFVDLFGLCWPVPREELASNRSHYLLSRALLKLEQSHHLNEDDGSGAPIPIFLGYTDSDVVDQILKSRQIWNEDTKMAGTFFHGKMTHRVHLYLLMKAMDLTLLDTGNNNIHDLLTIFISIRTTYTQTLVWNLLFDNVLTEYNVLQTPHHFDDPLASALWPHYPAQLQAKCEAEPYVYATDPYFLHCYLMSHSRTNTPYLSECVTQSFAKSARTIQRLERAVGKYNYYSESPELSRYRRQGKKELPLTPDQLDMKAVLARQAKYYTDIGWHVVTNEAVIADRNNSGKTARVNQAKSFGSVQYRSIFAKPDDQSRRSGINAGPVRRLK